MTTLLAEIEMELDDLSMDRMFVESEDTLKRLGLPRHYLFTVVEKDNPTHIISFQQGQVFLCDDFLTIDSNIKTYKVTLMDGDEITLFADSDETAKFALFEMFNIELISRMEKEVSSRSIIWAPEAL